MLYFFDTPISVSFLDQITHPALKQHLQALPEAELSPAMQSLLLQLNATMSAQQMELDHAKQTAEQCSITFSDYEHQLRTQAQNTLMFQQAVESSTEAIAFMAERGTIMYVNPAWEKLTGYAKAECLGQTIDLLRSGKTSVGVDDALKEALRTRQDFHSEEIVHKRKDGGEFNAAVTVYPITGADDLPLTVVMENDITERKLSDKSRAEFVSLASHQLRTPLTSVIWNLELLQGTDVAKMSRDQLENLLQGAHRSSKRMAETIDTLMQLSNLEVGKLQPNFTYVEMAGLFETIRTEQLSEYLKRQHTVSITCPPDLTVLTDPVILKEILSNLLNNAVKYTPAGGQIHFSAEKKDDCTLVRIADTGYGIPANQHEKVFSKFFRGENVQYIESSGNGLGLYLVHQLVRLLRGQITFTSEEHKGTTFCINLPSDPRGKALEQMS